MEIIRLLRDIFPVEIYIILVAVISFGFIFWRIHSHYEIRKKDKVEKLFSYYQEKRYKNFPILTEQVYSYCFSGTLNETEIDYLSTKRDPSYCLKRYISGRDYLEINNKNISFKKAYSTKLKRILSGLANLLLYFLYSSMAFGIIAYYADFPALNLVSLSALILFVTALIILAIFNLNELTKLSSAMALLNHLKRQEITE